MYCHVNVKTGSRGSGQSAAAKYDYISRAGKYGAASQDELVHLESGCMPSFASSDARLYWAAADCHERSNGRLFRSLTAALPNSLDSAGRLQLARSFAAHVTAGELPYTLAVHAGHSKKAGVADNPHLHLVFSERVNDGVERAAESWFRRAAPKGGDPAAGGAKKSERTKPRAWLEETRQAWAAEMNQAFVRAGVADEVTPESHAAQLARAREAGDAKEEERLLLSPPSQHIGPAAKHNGRTGRRGRRSRSRTGLSSTRRRRPLPARRGRRTRGTRRKRPRRGSRSRRSTSRSRRWRRSSGEPKRRPGGKRPHAAKRSGPGPRRSGRSGKRRGKPAERLSPTCPGAWSCSSQNWPISIRSGTWTATTRRRARTSIRPSTPPSRTTRVSGGFATCCRTRRPTPGSVEELDRHAGRFGTADIDRALAAAERDREERRQAEAAERKRRAATGRRVSRLEQLLSAPGGSEAFFAALDAQKPSWRQTGTRPSDIDRALDVAERGRDADEAPPWRHRLVLEAERAFPGAASTAWRDAGAGFNRSTEIGRQAGSVSQTLSDRARARALAAERPEPPASRGLVKRLFDWLRERVQKMLGRLRPSKAAHHQDRSPAGDAEATRAAAAERAARDRRQAQELITAARAAARKWGHIPLATDTVVSVAESISARPGTPAAQRAVLEQINWETAPLVGRSAEAARLRIRCQGEKAAAADERHRQALSEWSALPRRRRWMTRRPQRESPDPPSRQEVAAARGELVGVVRSAMITELEKVVPQAAAGLSARGRRPDPAAAATAHRDERPPLSRPVQGDGRVERPAEGQRHGPVHARDTRPKPAPATSPPRPPARRDRGHEPGL